MNLIEIYEGVGKENQNLWITDHNCQFQNILEYFVSYNETIYSVNFQISHHSIQNIKTQLK